MKLFVSILTVLIFFSCCRKSDIHLIRGKLVKCDVDEQSPIRVGYLVGNGFKKTYYDNGLVKTVLTKMNDGFGGFDSLRYSITYTYNKANVIADRWSFGLVDDGEGGFIIIPDPGKPPVQYNFVVEFDPKTLNAIKSGTTIFKYDKYGKFTGYDDFTVEYDNNGNIIKVNTANGGSVEYEYDYTKSARQQIYYTTGLMTNEMYNLMEIMNWIPVEPNNLRISHTLFVEADLFFGAFFFLNHVVDKKGILVSFSESFEPNKVSPEGIPPIINTSNCQPVFKTNAVK